MKHSIEDILMIVDSEPEFPGEMPVSIWMELKHVIDTNDKSAMEEYLRDVIRANKKSIKQRIFNFDYEQEQINKKGLKK